METILMRGISPESKEAQRILADDLSNNWKKEKKK
jgi:hypothetical protein